MKRKYINIGLFIILTFVLLVLSALRTSALKNAKVKRESESVLVYQSMIASVYRIHDDEKNVTCWISTQGISCIPDSQIK